MAGTTAGVARSLTGPVVTGDTAPKLIGPSVAETALTGLVVTGDMAGLSGLSLVEPAEAVRAARPDRPGAPWARPAAAPVLREQAYLRAA